MVYSTNTTTRTHVPGEILWTSLSQSSTRLLSVLYLLSNATVIWYITNSKTVLIKPIWPCDMHIAQQCKFVLLCILSAMPWISEIYLLLSYLPRCMVAPGGIMLWRPQSLDPASAPSSPLCLLSVRAILQMWFTAVDLTPFLSTDSTCICTMVLLLQVN